MKGFAQGHKESAGDAGTGPEPTSRMLGLHPDTALPLSHLGSRVNHPKGFWGEKLDSGTLQEGGRSRFGGCCCSAREMPCPTGPSACASPGAPWDEPQSTSKAAAGTSHCSPRATHPHRAPMLRDVHGNSCMKVLGTTLQGRSDPASPLGNDPKGRTDRQQPPSCPFCGINYWRVVSSHQFLGRERFAGEMKLRPLLSKTHKMPLKLSVWVARVPPKGLFVCLTFSNTLKPLAELHLNPL